MCQDNRQMPTTPAGGRSIRPNAVRVTLITLISTPRSLSSPDTEQFSLFLLDLHVPPSGTTAPSRSRFWAGYFTCCRRLEPYRARLLSHSAPKVSLVRTETVCPCGSPSRIGGVRRDGSRNLCQPVPGWVQPRLLGLGPPSCGKWSRMKARLSGFFHVRVRLSGRKARLLTDRARLPRPSAAALGREDSHRENSCSSCTSRDPLSLS